MDINIGVSACLLGQKVRYDANHRKDYYITNVLGKQVNFIPVCPEAESGMGVPREKVKLMGAVDKLSMIGEETGINWTAKMNRFARQKIKVLEANKIRGYIFKNDSPSCGVEKVKIINEKGNIVRKGRGLFANQILKDLPLLPVIEDRKLVNPKLRDNFIVRLFAYDRLKNLLDKRFKINEIKEFHFDHKYLIMSHSIEHYGLLDKLIVNNSDYKSHEFKRHYSFLFMEAFQQIATIRKNTKVLRLIVENIKSYIDIIDKKFIVSHIKDYQKQLAPLNTPLTIIRYFVEKYEIKSMFNQYYLNPHPKEVILRNHA